MPRRDSDKRSRRGSRAAKRRRFNRVSWLRLRKMVLARDNYMCRVCGNVNSNEVDHIVPVAQGGSNELENLQTLCKTCHSRKTSEETGFGASRRAPTG